MTRPNSVVWSLSFTWILSNVLPLSESNHDAKRLYDDLLRKNRYNKLIRPVGNSTNNLTVRLGLRLAQLIDVDEKNQIISLNVWMLQEWDDYSLRWDPKEYGDVKELYVPSESIWIPDIVLYNNADGDYTVTLMTKATLSHTGRVIWEPPAIYKSQCDINVKYFPFDQQECRLKFGSWSYDGYQVDLQHVWHTKYGPLEIENITIDRAVDFKNFYRNIEWDVMDAPARKNIKYYPCCPEPYPDITFNITIRRRTMFYTINLIIPCISINMLTMLGFYLPSDCGEKISLCISILLSLSLFQLLLMDIVPPTSLTIPLIGNYILFTCILVSLSVFFSVLVLNITFRTSVAAEMSNCTRKIFLEIMPKILLMRKPASDWLREQQSEEMDWSSAHCDLSNYGNPYKKKFRRVSMSYQQPSEEETQQKYSMSSSFVGVDGRNVDLSNFCSACAQRNLKKQLPNVQKALDGVAFIASHLKDEDKHTRIKEDWKYLALVIDRLLLWIYVCICIVGAVGILMNAPVLYDHRVPIAENDSDVKFHD